jgi:hypothetical protein
MSKLIYSLPLMLTGLGAAALTPSIASAHEPAGHHGHHPAHRSHYYPPARVYPAVGFYPAPVVPILRQYQVLYRGCAVEPWRVHAVYETRFGADRDAARLQLSGFEVSIREML